MNSIDSIYMKNSPNYFNNVKMDKYNSNQDEFKNLINRQLQEKISDKFSNYNKGISIPPMVLDKLKSASSSMFEDVTNHEDFVQMHECGESKLYRAYLDNCQGTGEKAFYLIRLKPCSRDAIIDPQKLEYIFEKAMEIAKKVMPIYSKLSGTATLAGVDHALPFSETTGKVDFESFTKNLLEHLDGEINNSSLDDNSKEALQKMLKECEDFLMKSMDDGQVDKLEVLQAAE